MMVLSLVVVTLVIGFALVNNNDNELLKEPSVAYAEGDEACIELVQRAFEDFEFNCAGLGSNSACLGYAAVDATVSQASFKLPGDHVDLSNIKRISTSSINVDDQTYGLAVLNLQTNLHTASREFAVMVLAGDVTIDNVVESGFQPTTEIEVSIIENLSVYRAPGSGANVVGELSEGDAVLIDALDMTGNWGRILFENQPAWIMIDQLEIETSDLPDYSNYSLAPMQAFDLRTGTTSGCDGAPMPAVMLQSPRGMMTIFIVNGALVEASSTLFMRTVDEFTLRIAVSEGEATLYPGSYNEVTVPTGVSVDIPLDENGQAVGRWEDWQFAAQELNQFIPFKELPESILNGPFNGLNFFQPSGVGQPPQVPPGGEDEDIPYTPVPFPDIDLSYGEPGEDLEPGAFETISIGPATCPDWVFFHSDRDDDWDLYRLWTTINNVSNGPDSGDIQPTFSQDGDWVAFTSNRVDRENWEIFVAAADGSDVQRLTYNTGNDINPAWGPDGRIIFETNRDGNWELYFIDVTQGLDLTRITDDSANDVNAHWLRSQNAILFQSDRDGDWEIFRLDLGTRDIEQLTDNTVEDIMPMGSHDEAQMIWLQQNAFGVFDLWLMDLEAGDTEQLTDTATTVAGHSFSPDDTFVAYHTRFDGDYDVFALSLDERDGVGNRVVKNLSDNQDDTENDGFEDRSPTFRCDSSVVIFNSNRIEQQQDLFEVNAMPLTGPLQSSTRLTVEEKAYDIFPVADPRDEVNSRQDELPAHP